MAFLELTVENSRLADPKAPTIAVLCMDPSGGVKGTFEAVAALRPNVAIYFGTTDRVGGQTIPPEFQSPSVEVYYLKDGRNIAGREGTPPSVNEVVESIDRYFPSA